MESRTTKNSGKLTSAVSGRIDIITVPELEKRLDKELDGVKRLVLDFSNALPEISRKRLNEGR